MSSKDQVFQIVDSMPEYKVDVLLDFLRVFMGGQEDIPNAETVAALLEGDEMLRTGSGQGWTGSTKDLFNQILEEDDEESCWRSNRLHSSSVI